MKRNVIIVIVIVISIILCALSVVFYQNIQNKRNIEVHVITDKENFSIDENVTFELLIDNPGREFYYQNPNDDNVPGYYSNNYGVYIIRVPDSMSPSELIDSYQDTWWFSVSSTSGFIQIDVVSSDVLSMELTWNRTISDGSIGGGYCLAPSGQYCLIPLLPSYEEDDFKSFLTEDNFFNLEGLVFDASIALDEEENKTCCTVTVGNPWHDNLTSTIDANLWVYVDMATDDTLPNEDIYENFTLEVNGSRTFLIEANGTSASEYFEKNWVHVCAVLTTEEGSYKLYVQFDLNEREWSVWYQ